MNKNVIKHLVSLIVFFGALIVFSIITNQVNEDLTTTMSDATLPVMYFYNDGRQINELHGYKEEMDSLSMRDSITPISSDRKLSMSVSTYGLNIDEIRYEIRTMDASRLVAESEVSDYQAAGNEIKADITVQNLLENNEEYLLIFSLTSGSDSYYYYSRIMQTTDCYAKECLDFAMEFHDNTFDESKKNFFPTYLDKQVGDNSTLSYVDLSCSYKQIMWGDFKGDILGKTIASFKEINESYNVITIQYVITANNDAGETEYFNIEEYYRLRYSDTRMYVLNFERTMEQVFRGENNFINNSTELLLGIRDRNVEYKTNEAGNVICFTQAGDLWCFDKSSNEMTEVFSFRGIEGIDIRENWNQHKIKIVSVDEAGSVEFIVYGYMNKGDHEGCVGTAVYHYDGLARTVEEEAFIPSDTSFEVLAAEMGQLMYKNEKGILYILLEGHVYSIDMSTYEVKSIIEDLEAGCYASSDSNKYFAWVESGEKNSSTVLQIMNLENGSIYEVSEGSDKYLRPMGFIDDDFIYGIADASDIVTDAAGNATFAMSALKILDTSEDKYTELKNYTPRSGYIKSISVDEYTITVNLIKQSSNRYVDDGTDAIMNRNTDTEENIVINYYTAGSSVTEDDPEEHNAYAMSKEAQIQLSMNSAADASKIKLLTSQGVLLEKDTTVKVKCEDDKERFYVYVRGQVTLATDSISDAISKANDQMGVVIDSKQQYVWERARKTYATAFSNISPNSSDESSSSVVKCVSAMIKHMGADMSVSSLFENGSTAKSVISAALPSAVVLDVSGCSAEDVLFYVSNGNPVLAMTGSDSAVLITGYSTTNIYFYNPSNGKTESVSYENAEDMFIEGSNRFIVCMNR